MTIEHRILVGLGDLKSITCECRACGLRLSIAPAKLQVMKLRECPACPEPWLDLAPKTGDCYRLPLPSLVAAIADHAAMPESNPKRGVTILFEFEDPNG